MTKPPMVKAVIRFFLLVVRKVPFVFVELRRTCWASLRDVYAIENISDSHQFFCSYFSINDIITIKLFNIK